MARIPTRLTPAMADAFTRAGYWPNTTFAAELGRQVRVRGGKIAVVDDRMRLTYRELGVRAARLAAALAARGVGRGDVVASILPNRAEAVVLFYATSRLGAVLSPIVPIYGPREIRFILRQVESVAVVVQDRCRGVDFPTLVDRVAADVPALRVRVVVGASARPGWLGFEALHAPSAPPVAEPAADAPGGAAGPDEVAAILYTSGTTAEPKGVLHTSNTLLCECRNTIRYHRLIDDEVFVMPSPVSHISGLLYGVMLPIVSGGTSVLMEQWNPEHFLALVERERGTYSAGATPFLQGVLDCPALDRYDVRSLRRFPCGGADVPPGLIRRSISRLGVRSGRGYGSTEFPSITSSAGPDVPEAKRAETDGAPIDPSEVELRDRAGRVVGAGEEGEIWARGPELCLGYRDAGLDGDVFDPRGFFRTGDLGVLDADGYLTVTGRVKDIIVRGGEKLSAREIEDLLLEHPKVKSVAVVPMPDRVLGERVCAVVVPEATGDAPSLAELVRFLEAREISRRKLPERLEIADELPVTASGKVAKHLLRERIARAMAGERRRS
jgi:cyclohexanecarboxylate-CoA ligase